MDFRPLWPLSVPGTDQAKSTDSIKKNLHALSTERKPICGEGCLNLKELLKNRDHWKKKAKKTEVQVNELQKEFNELKKN